MVLFVRITTRHQRDIMFSGWGNLICIFRCIRTLHNGFGPTSHELLRSSNVLSNNVGVRQTPIKTTHVLNPRLSGLGGAQATSCKGFCQVKKIQKSEKNSEVGGWVKRQLGLLFFWEIVFFCVFCVVFCCCTFFKKNIQNWIGGGWVVSGKSDFFSNFWIFFNLTRPLNVTHT